MKQRVLLGLTALALAVAGPVQVPAASSDNLDQAEAAGARCQRLA